MAFLIGGANSLTAAYDVDNSLRFNGPDDEHVSLALSSPNTDIFTISFWIKLGPADAYRNHPVIIHKALTGETGDYTNFVVQWALDGGIGFSNFDGVNNEYHLRWAATDANAPMRLRDYSAWYHVVLRMDSSQGVTANRAKFYINNSDISANFTHTTDPDQNDDYFTASGSTLYVGGVNASAGAEPFSGYIAEFAYVDGTSYAPSTFAEADADSGIWKPKDFKGSVTWGTNGAYLEFKESGTGADANGMGADTSGEDNHMTVSNLTAVAQSTDTPTNNFCVLNSINPTESNASFSEGNLRFTNTLNSSPHHGLAHGTMAVAKGKWYWEVRVDAVGGTAMSIGAEEVSEFAKNNFTGSKGVGYFNNSATHARGADGTTGDVTFTTNDIIGVALDMDNRKIYFHKNGTYVNSGDPTSGATGTGAISLDAADVTMAPAVSNYNSGICNVNFGSPQWAVSSSQADDDGYGNFEYDVPASFFALCTKNLAEYG